MEQTVGFDPSEHGLHAIGLDLWGGFIFVCLDPLAPPLAQWLGELPQRLAMYGLDQMAATRRAAYTVACNWKLWVENFMEGYHIPTVHRSTISKKKAINHAEDPPADGQFEAIWEVHEGTLALLDDDPGFPAIESLAGDLAGIAKGSRFVLVYPSTMFAITIDALWSFECHPLGPESTRVVLTSCFPKSRLERPDFAVLAQNYYKRQNIVAGEDNDISEMQQRGLSNALAAPGRLSFKEKIVHALDNWVLDRVLDPAPMLRLATAA
jgi:phenylpropionate dioxygenase-like ring-hydroxylating dioxygenase large terminal subunit